MKPLDALKIPLAIALLSGATMSGADVTQARLTPVVERRADPVSAPVRSDSAGGRSIGSLSADTKTPDPKRSDWMMVLAGLAIAGWIAQRRMGAPLE